MLSTSSDHALIETTDVSLDLKCYGFGKYFLGDVRAGIIEQEQYFYGEPDDMKGLMTDYCHYWNKMGEEYFSRRRLGKSSDGSKQDEDILVYRADSRCQNVVFCVGGMVVGECDFDHRIATHFHIKTMGGAPFGIETVEYVIVLGGDTGVGG